MTGAMLLVLWTAMDPSGLRDAYFYTGCGLFVVGALLLLSVASSVSAAKKAEEERASESRWQELKQQEQELVRRREATPGVVIREKETVQVVVKIPCRHCGTLVESTLLKCPVCGAPLR